MASQRSANGTGLPVNPESRAEGALTDSFGREVRYLRLSITDRCDLRCVYCMPVQGNPMSAKPEVLTVEETVRAVAVFQRLGVVTVRITGGEPLVRRGVVDIIRAIHRDLGIDDIALSTNATRLAEMGPELREAGVRRVNISLDTLIPERLHGVSRRGDLAAIVRGVDAARDLGFEERKLNTVAMKGINDDELGPIVDFAWERGFTPRFIELMPIGEGANLFPEHHLGLEEMLERLGDRVSARPKQRREGRGPARYATNPLDPRREVGFISAISENFCEGCNRVRLSAKGELRPCLASPQGVSLRDLMRAGATDEEIAWEIRKALYGKDTGHHFTDETVSSHQLVTMSGIGG